MIWATVSFGLVFAQLCPTLCDSMDYSMLGFPVHPQLLELTQTHAHQVGDAIQPYYLLSSPSLPTFNLSQDQGLFLRSQLLIYVRLFAALWTAAHQASLHCLLEFGQTHVGWVSDAIQPSRPLSFPFSSHLRSFPTSGSFQWVFFFFLVHFFLKFFYYVLMNITNVNMHT